MWSVLLYVRVKIVARSLTHHAGEAKFRTFCAVQVSESQDKKRRNKKGYVIYSICINMPHNRIKLTILYTTPLLHINVQKTTQISKTLMRPVGKVRPPG